MPQVSICLPTYNRVKFLQRCLPTILQQTFPDFEVIVSDNCSTDSTAEFIASCRDKRIRYYRNSKNIGPYPNMNRTLELARGAYVCILHDDDLYAPDFLARERDLLDRHPTVGMVHSAVYEIDVHGAYRRIIRAYPTSRVLDGRKEFKRFLEGHNVCCSSVMMRREVLERTGLFDARYLCADFLMWLKFALYSDIAYIADPLVSMRVHADTVTSWLDPVRWYQEFVEIVERGFELATATYPAVLESRKTLLHRAAQAQSKRFLIAALSASVRGNFELARGYTDIVEKFQAFGASRVYAVFARASTNRFGRSILLPVQWVRQAYAARVAVTGSSQ